jgi:hypothetical protein
VGIGASADGYGRTIFKYRFRLGTFEQVERKAGTRAQVGVSLEQQSVFPFSPLAFQVSLRTSNFHARNRPTGATMNPIKLSDVKSHLRPPFLTKTHLDQPESQPDATGFSTFESDAIKAGSSVFAEDFVAEHSSSDATLAKDNSQGNSFIGSSGSQAPAISRSVQS